METHTTTSPNEAQIDEKDVIKQNHKDLNELTMNVTNVELTESPVEEKNENILSNNTNAEQSQTDALNTKPIDEESNDINIEHQLLECLPNSTSEDQNNENIENLCSPGVEKHIVKETLPAPSPTIAMNNLKQIQEEAEDLCTKTNKEAEDTLNERLQEFREDAEDLCIKTKQAAEHNLEKEIQTPSLFDQEDELDKKETTSCSCADNENCSCDRLHRNEFEKAENSSICENFLTGKNKITNSISNTSARNDNENLDLPNESALLNLSLNRHNEVSVQDMDSIKAMDCTDSTSPAKQNEITEDNDSTEITTESSPKLNGSNNASPSNLEHFHESKETNQENVEKELFGRIDENLEDIKETIERNDDLKEVAADTMNLSTETIQSKILYDNTDNSEKKSFENQLAVFNEHISETANDLNASHYSSTESLNSSSTFRSSSSHQLVIDQPTEEEKLPPLRLKLKRKLTKSNSSLDTIPPLKKTHIEENFIQDHNPLNLSNLGESNISVANEIQTNLEIKQTIEDTSIIPPIDFSKNIDSSQSLSFAANNETIPTITDKSENVKINDTSEICEKIVVDDQIQQENLISSKPPSTKYYKCTSCGTYHEGWSFFLHLQEKHDRFLCLYCIKCFRTAEKLALHLEIRHDLEQNHFNSEEAFRKSGVVIHGFLLETRFLMCCTCQYIFRENAAFTEHVCNDLMKACEICGQKGRHAHKCKANPALKRRNKKNARDKLKPSIEPLIPIEPPPPLLPPPPPIAMLTQEGTIATQPEQNTILRPENEDSNSSSNMVIDESCNTNHSLINQINPFKALDESERMDDETQELTNCDANNSLNTEQSSDSLNKSSLFKFKLRVPKEFQKPVDEAVSTSESENGVFEDEATNETKDSNQRDFDTTTNVTTSTTMEAYNQDEQHNLNSITENNNVQNTINFVANIDESEVQGEVDNEGEETGGEDDYDNDDGSGLSDTHLARILKEIEQTKLDIEKTKETIHQRKTSELSKKSETMEQSEIVENIGKPLTITPPATPNLITAEQIEPSLNNIENENSFSMETTNESEDLNKTESDFEKTEEDQHDDEEENKTDSNNQLVQLEPPASVFATDPDPIPTTPPPPPAPDDGIELANEDCLIIDLQLDRPLDKFETVEFVRICLKAAYPYCLYCNHARRIAVNAESLVLHLLAQHRFKATVDSITAEELQPNTLIAKLKSFLTELQNEYMNSNSYCTIGDGRFTRHFNERIFECFQCRFATSTHKELYLHNRKMHLRTAILCFMCRCNFYSFSEILCHICPGAPHKVSIFEIKFRCCLCELTNIPSPFRLMVHLRKRHFACDVCLEDCRDQSKLSSHVWKHKLHHLCYRCGIAYRNKLDITKHLFWKHGTESAICKRCLNKRWPHVYHFCVPPSTFICEICQLCFSKAMYLTVHKRLHNNDFRYPCTEENCEAKFISRKLLLNHAEIHKLQTIENKMEIAQLEQQETKLDIEKAEENDDKTKNNAPENELINIKEENKNENDNEMDSEMPTKAENETKQIDASVVATDDNKNQTSIQNESPEIIKPINKQHKKKKKRAKESLEDLNLTAPNLSESGSSSESESDTKSTKIEDDLSRAGPQLSPHSEQDDIKTQDIENNVENNGKVMEIWKNFLQAQAGQSTSVDGESIQQFVEYTDDDYPEPKCLHVCISDHDYCAMYRTSPKPKSQQSEQQKSIESKKRSNSNKQLSTSIDKNNSNNFSSSSDDDDETSDTSSSSSCSCGSNCSCSNNGSSSSSSSGDSHTDNSDSSTASISKKRLRKKSERSSRHKKSLSSSPMKSRNLIENLNNCDNDENTQQNIQTNQNNDEENEIENNIPLEPSINESDLETAESETDEEYYDEHPQKLATELLSKKRAELMARTLLSPSHNYDIVENSRPSTPSLPEDVVYEKRKKKKKRERKSTTNKTTDLMTGLQQFLTKQHTILETNIQNDDDEIVITQQAQHNYPTQQQQQHQQHQQLTTMETTIGSHLTEHMHPVEQQQQIIRTQQLQLQQQHQQRQHAIGNYAPRISDSSCSDADTSLKRSKRMRRPNKFYGYTSEDESMASSALGQSLIIGMRTYKPQPPPQLVWDKEDLPAPSKSILNTKKTPRTSRQQSDESNLNSNTPQHSAMSEFSTSSQKKRRSASLQRSHKKRTSKHSLFDRQKFPPIPRLKIRPALFHMSGSNNSNLAQTSAPGEDSSDASSEVETQNPTIRKKQFPSTQLSAASSFLPRYPPQTAPTPVPSMATAPVVIPPVILPTAMPPTPQTTAFNHKIPPALLPNPDFSTLQYFKANNIRYPIRPPAGARAAREGESVYCYCRCPYDEVSEMIACDGDSCLIEWFHFECVGIMVAPQGKWFCAECRPRYSEELYPTSATTTTANLIRDQ